MTDYEKTQDRIQYAQAVNLATEVACAWFEELDYTETEDGFKEVVNKWTEYFYAKLKSHDPEKDYHEKQNQKADRLERKEKVFNNLDEALDNDQ